MSNFIKIHLGALEVSRENRRTDQQAIISSRTMLTCATSKRRAVNMERETERERESERQTEK